jgi:hypothetical protein
MTHEATTTVVRFMYCEGADRPVHCQWNRRTSNET